MPTFAQYTVTRAEYAESGSNASRRKFRDWKPQEPEKEKPKDNSKLKGKQRDDDRTQPSGKLTRTRSKRRWILNSAVYEVRKRVWFELLRDPILSALGNLISLEIKLSILQTQVTYALATSPPSTREGTDVIF